MTAEEYADELCRMAAIKLGVPYHGLMQQEPKESERPFSWERENAIRRKAEWEQMKDAWHRHMEEEIKEYLEKHAIKTEQQPQIIWASHPYFEDCPNEHFGEREGDNEPTTPPD